MGYCNCKVTHRVIINSEMVVPADNETIMVIPKRKSTKYVKISTSKDITQKDTDISTESYLRQKSLLRQSQILEIYHPPIKVSNDKIVEIREITRTSTTNLSSTQVRMIQEEDDSDFNSKEQENLMTILKKHFLFKEISDNYLKLIIEEIVETQVDEDSIIFKKGELGAGLFIIKKGQVELSKTIDSINNLNTLENHNNDNNDNDHLNKVPPKFSHMTQELLNAGDSFGELSLVIENSVRNYTVKALTPVSFYIFDSNTYQLIKSKSGLVYTKKSISSNTSLFEYLNENPFLKSLSLGQKENLTGLSYLYQTNKDEEFEDNDNVFILIEGSCICDNSVNKIICEQGAYLGLENIFSTINNTHNFTKKIIAITDCLFICIPIKAFREVFGIDYRYIMSYHFFKYAILSNKLLKGLLNESQTKTLFNMFKMVRYKNGDIVYSKEKSDHYSKVVLVFDGELTFENDELNCLVSVGELYGVDMLNGSLLKNIASKGQALIFECPWEKIKELSQSVNHSFGKKLRRLKTIDFLKSLLETKLIEITNHIISFTFHKDEEIISSNIPCEHFYFLYKGEVKHMVNNKTIRKYTEGSSFGETFLLNETDTKSYMVASSNLVKTYAINKEYFFTLIEDPELNDYIKRKFCLENKGIKLNDLYYLTYLGRGRFGNVSLVHNQISLYAAKAISRSAVEKQKSGIRYLLNEKKTLQELNHPFILKLVKTMKTSNWCFFLLEFVTGKTMNDYLSVRKSKRSIEEAKFYGGCLFIILDYLNSQGFIHRDIKPSNLMIDYSGYIKMVDFGGAKNIHNGSAKTIIGTPHFMAPEVINGKWYSYPCDYWSVGITLYDIYYGECPYGKDAKEITEIYDEILAKEISFKSDASNYEFNNLLRLLLNKNPKERFTNFKAISNHLFFKDFPWEQLVNKQVKPPFIPPKDKRFDEYNLNNTNTTFLSLMETEKITIESHRCMNKYKLDTHQKATSSSTSLNGIRYYNKNWFDEF